jgi:alpha-galactosidase
MAELKGRDGRMEIIADITFADTTARYVSDSSGRVGLMLFPSAMAGRLAARRATLRGEPFIDALPGARPPQAIAVDPLVHLKLVGDAYSGGFAQGRTMRNAPSIDRFRFSGQEREHDGSRTTVVTRLASADGLRLEHRLSWHSGEAAAQIATTVINGSPRPVTSEMLSSFAIGGITPFDAADAAGRLRVHRFRSVWSAEGRLQTQSVEELHLERSWTSSGLFSERFGQLGTMPVRGWFPFVAVEDTAAGVTWGAQLAWAGSWQLEISRQNDDLCLSGGLADREFGHWTKTLAAGESLTVPPATIGCVRGSLDDLCDRLTSVQARPANLQPRVEQDLPIVFNEWCATWGDPRHDRVVELAERLAGTAVKYLVIDAGWYKTEGADWYNCHGDWAPSARLFPDGLAATAAAIRRRGLIPGIWFEVETVGDASTAFSLADHLLTRDGIPITVGCRRFWNLNDPAAIDYLAQRVIGTLRDCGFGYLKVDYNETAGLGCDGAESQGEGLRRQVLGIYRFFDRIRAELKDLVIENCSSGGHRLEPSMLARTAMSSFSDAHELPEIPIIAANLHRLMLPRQSLIWAVLHATDDERRLDYSLASAFLGRMCLSGEVDRLSQTQWARVQEAMACYRRAAPIIRDGTSRRFGQIGQSWRHPSGWQAVVRTAADGRSALAVLHAFAAPPSADLRVPLPPGDWNMINMLGDCGSISRADGGMTWNGAEPFSAKVVLLDRGGIADKSRQTGRGS